MIDGNLDLSIRMKQLPKLTTEGKKQVDIEVNTSLGPVICSVKSKSFRKIEKTIEGFSHEYVVMLSGKEIEKDGGIIRLKGCGLQVFEKKPKGEAKEATEPKPQQAKKEPEPAPLKVEKKSEAKIEAGIRTDGKRVFIPEPAKWQQKSRKPDQTNTQR